MLLPRVVEPVLPPVGLGTWAPSGCRAGCVGPSGSMSQNTGHGEPSSSLGIFTACNSLQRAFVVALPIQSFKESFKTDRSRLMSPFW